MSRTVDPFKLIGEPSSWGTHGSSVHDAACDAERSALIDHFLRRMAKGQKKGRKDVIADIMTGGSVAMAGLYISAAGGPEALSDDSFDRWIAIMTFAWYQAISTGTAGSIS